MHYALWRCRHFGKVLSGDQHKAVALVLFPDHVHFSFFGLFRDLWLIIGVIGIFKLCKVLHKENLLARLRPAGKLYYLWFIGVSPPDQRMGYGSKLLQELCVDAAALGRVICLETSVTENLPWYRAHGFELYHTLNAGGHPLYFLRQVEPFAVA